MKKNIILVATILTASVLAVAYQSNRSNQNAESSSIATVSENVDDNTTENLDENEMFYKTHGYKQLIPDDLIVKGDKISTGKIQLFNGRELSVGNPYPEDSRLETSLVKTEDGSIRYLYHVKDYNDKDIEIYYLFNDDNYIVRAETSEVNYLDGEVVLNYSAAIKDTVFYQNAYGTAFAWRNETDSYAVSTTVATSVWALEEGETLHLIWCNKDCPIWAD